MTGSGTLTSGARTGHNVVYLPGLMTDNPGLDVEEYRKQLAHLDPVTRKQLEEGDWDVQLSGGVLDVTKLRHYTSGEFNQRVRYWDFAATKQKEGVDADWTAGVLMGVEDGEYQVQDVQRFREGPAEVEARVRSQAEIDGPNVPVRIEQEPGSFPARKVATLSSSSNSTMAASTSATRGKAWSLGLHL